MWLVTKYGFFSVVAHPQDHDLVQVRARSRVALEHLRGFAQGRDIPIPDIVMTPTADHDYCCRIFMPRPDWTRLGGELAAEIDYFDFKLIVAVGDEVTPLTATAMLSQADPGVRMVIIDTRPFDVSEDDATEDEPEEWDEDEVFDFLDTLRDSGVTNMFGARPYLQETFGFDRDTAARWLTQWMKSYGRRHGLEAQP
ncbi:MAG: hypothetical protein KBE23_06650 [Chloroflexi bacterium]|nr:hypothetical protein [Chloroflexota bacterium]MBP7042405.1 hypothetical protein [Chloroflexota bacterium]